MEEHTPTRRGFLAQAGLTLAAPLVAELAAARAVFGDELAASELAPGGAGIRGAYTVPLRRAQFPAGLAQRGEYDRRSGPLLRGSGMT